jgi:hypothetical protein
MPGKIHRYLADDHARLERLLQRAASRPNEIEASAYAEFRAGLLKHIAIEEKILLPAARRLRGGEPLPAGAKLRLDHGALAALLVPTPTNAIIAKIHAVLNAHNPVEEGPGGVYEVCEKLAAYEAESLLAQMRGMPDVKLAPHVDGPQVMEAARRAVERAGHRWDVSGEQ